MPWSDLARRHDPARGTAQATGASARHRAAAGEGDDRQRGPARSARAGQVARADAAAGGFGAPGIEAALRRGCGNIHAPRSDARTPRSDRGGHRRHAAGEYQPTAARCAPGYDAELDELRDLSQNGRQYIAQIEARERTRTGIASLKVRFNNVFGYYIEISKANLHLAPADYERKQTLVNAERFTTPELKEYERKILAAEEKILEIEKRDFRGDAAERRPIRRSGFARPPRAVAELDVAGALAQVAAENRYARPQFSRSTARCGSPRAAIR